jgi:hypothetical protein
MFAICFPRILDKVVGFVLGSFGGGPRKSALRQILYLSDGCHELTSQE